MANTTEEEPTVSDKRRSLARVAASLLAAFLPGTASAELAEGDAAPSFVFQGSDGREYSLAGLLESGKQGIVLAFFPKAFTPG
jgi:hypothetical protein